MAKKQSDDGFVSNLLGRIGVFQSANKKGNTSAAKAIKNLTTALKQQAAVANKSYSTQVKGLQKITAQMVAQQKQATKTTATLTKSLNLQSKAMAKVIQSVSRVGKTNGSGGGGGSGNSFDSLASSVVKWASRAADGSCGRDIADARVTPGLP